MILYEDNDIIVCHKPAGVPVQSASIRTKDMVSILRTHLQEGCGQESVRSGKDAQDVYVVHRLDQPVEGVMVFAKTKRAAADLSRQAAGNGMKKRYHAVVELTEESAGIGVPGAHAEALEEQPWYTLVDYLVKDGRSNRSFVSEAGKKDAKRAELRYRILKKGKKSALALVEVELKTGRHHQIRVQMAHAGMPLYGDRKYNPGNTGKAAPSTNTDTREANHSRRDAVKEEPPAQSLALCAVSLTFRHPQTHKEMTFSVEPKAEIFREPG